MENLNSETKMPGEEETKITKETTQRFYTPEGAPIKSEEPVTVKQWLLFWLVSLINIIPLIGFICYVIFILYVAFKNDARFPVSMQNFCKAYLVLIAIGIVGALLFAGTIFSAIVGMGMGY